MTTTIQARFDGYVLVPQGRVDLPSDRTLTLLVQEMEITPAPVSQFPWPLLNLPFDPELARGIAEEPQWLS